MALTKEQIDEAKKKGFLRNRGTDSFSARVVVPGGVYSPVQLELIARCAGQFGSGKVAFTVRQCAEIVGVPYESIEKAADLLQAPETGLVVGGTGPRVRPVAACKGTTCVFGLADTQTMAAQLHGRYYLGEVGTGLPHKFKISVGGCPNSCIKPSLNDFGLEACREKGQACYKVFVGGTWGRKTRVGDLLHRRVEPAEVFPVLDRVLGWYRAYGRPKERLGAVIDRVGLESLEKAVFLELPH